MARGGSMDVPRPATVLTRLEGIETRFEGFASETSKLLSDLQARIDRLEAEVGIENRVRTGLGPPRPYGPELDG